MHKLSLLISLTFYIRRIILGIYQFAFGIFYHLIIKDTALMMLGVNVMFIWFSTLTKLIQVQHELVWMESSTSTKCIHHFIIFYGFMISSALYIEIGIAL